MDDNKQCDGCQVSASVPYAAFEAVSARAERNIRRLALIIVFLILALIGSNIAWLCYESQFEDVTSQTEQTVTQDTAGGGDNNFVGGDWEHLIEQYIFNEQHRRIFKRRWLDGVCFEPLAEEFDISVRHAQSIVYKCEKKILRHI